MKEPNQTNNHSPREAPEKAKTFHFTPKMLAILVFLVYVGLLIWSYVRGW